VIRIHYYQYDTEDPIPPPSLLYYQAGEEKWGKVVLLLLLLNSVRATELRRSEIAKSLYPTDIRNAGAGITTSTP
tara:strand:+ start:833 stop:1057 length:225 start_codon:yes stop_codon:yes gene_type:complete